ncbi:MAG: sialate O-acetylesterase [Bacteroidota bacterium]
MRFKAGLAAIIFTLLTGLCYTATATVSVSGMFSSHMVLQRNAAFKVWGWADRGERVTVTLNGKSGTTNADNKGNWEVKLPPMPEGGPYTLAIMASNTIQFSDVMLGDVWLAGGQSNMEFTLADLGPDFKHIIRASDSPGIRMIKVERQADLNEQSNIVSKGWKGCNPATAAHFSAVAYFFAQRLFKETNITIGIVSSNWGGTPAEAWASKGALKDFAPFNSTIKEYESGKFKSYTDYVDFKVAESRSKLQAYIKAHKELVPNTKPEFLKGDFSKFRDGMNVPGHWETQMLKDFDGILFLHKQITLPKDIDHGNLTLKLAKIDDNDSTFINGTFAGSTHGWNEPRKYNIPLSALKSDKIDILIRIEDMHSEGGVFGAGPDVCITDGRVNVPLSGSWQYLPGFKRNVPEIKMYIKKGWPTTPSVLNNGMIAPISRFSVKGTIWYQGEENAGRAAQYYKLLPALIADWRSQFRNPDMPFYIVQLANYMDLQTGPEQSEWAELRDAQFQTAKTVPHTGLAVAIDLGEADNIHPKRKEEVGNRLANLALRDLYGKKNLVAEGPTYKSMSVDGPVVTLEFDNVGKGEKIRNIDGSETIIYIAGEGTKWYKADRLDIVGNKIIVSSESVGAPASVRYGWANNPKGANLYNSDGLPMVPFRTDDFKLKTFGKE